MPLVSPATSGASVTKATNRPSADSDGVKLPRSDGLPPSPAPTRAVRPVWPSWTKTSEARLASPGVTLPASVAKATNRPSPEIEGAKTSPFTWAPLWPRLTRVVRPEARSRTKMSVSPLVSSRTRLVASEAKATNRPSAEIDGLKLAPLPGLPSEARLTLVVLPVLRSRTKTSSARFRSPGTSPLASEAKAT